MFCIPTNLSCCNYDYYLGTFITLQDFVLIICGICHNSVKELITSGLRFFFFRVNFEKLPFQIWGMLFLH